MSGWLSDGDDSDVPGHVRQRGASATTNPSLRKTLSLIELERQLRSLVTGGPNRETASRDMPP